MKIVGMALVKAGSTSEGQVIKIGNRVSFLRCTDYGFVYDYIVERFCVFTMYLCLFLFDILDRMLAQVHPVKLTFAFRDNHTSECSSLMSSINTYACFQIGAIILLAVFMCTYNGRKGDDKTRRRRKCMPLSVKLCFNR